MLCAGTLTLSLNVGAISACIPFISEDLNISEFLAAKIVPYYMLPYGIGALIYAPLTEKYSYRSILAWSVAGYAVSSFICAATSSLNIILFGRVVMGITSAGLVPLAIMIIGEIFEKKSRGRLMGLFFSFAFLANFIGLAMMGLAHWRWLFIVPGIMSVALTGLLLLAGGQTLKSVHGQKINYLESLKKKEIFHIFVFISLISMLYHAVQKWYGVYLVQEYGFDKTMISFLLIVSMVGGLIGQNLGGFLSDSKNRLVSCYIGIYGLAFTSMLLLGHFHTAFLAAVLFLMTMFWTVGHNGISTVLTDFAHTDRAVLASLNSGVRFLFGGVGFMISGIFVEKSFGWTFFVIGVLFFILSFSLKHVIPSFSKGEIYE